jgi:hypothetical protein
MLSRMLSRRGPVENWYHAQPDGTFVIETRQDVAPIIERNKALQTANDGFTPSRDMARVASIPVVVQYEWLKRYGVNIFDREHEARVRRLLNDPEWRYLRTSEIYL